MIVALFLAVSYGISNIVVHGSIFEGMRNLFNKINPGFLGALVSCMICFPTWVGFVISYVLTLYGYTHLTPFGSIGLEVLWLRIFLDGCLTSGVVWFIHTAQEKLEQ